MDLIFLRRFLLAVLTAVCALGQAQDLKPIQLPPPQTEGGRPLMQVLKERATSREFRADKLPPQVLSNLLWAAWGINRSDSGKRTAPSASNRQEIEIYAAMADGLYLYDAKTHALKGVLAADLRAATGNQEFVGQAPLNLVYVADLSRMGGGDPQRHAMTLGADTGFIAQNVYLFCASERLATVVRGLVDREKLAQAMKLRPDQRITYSQTVGYPR